MEKISFFYCFALLAPLTGHAENPVIERQPDAYRGMPLTLPSAIEKPDESMLWALFHAQKFRELKLQIEQLQARFPHWRVPGLLLDAAKGRAQPAETSAMPIHRARPVPQRKTTVVYDPCRGMGEKWDRAEAMILKGRSADALEHYSQILRSCSNSDYRLTTLEKASVALNYELFIQLLQLGRNYLPHGDVDRIEYRRLKDEYLKETRLDAEHQNYQVSRLQPWIERYNDDDIAEVVAWRFFDIQNFTEAKFWFAKVLSWNADHEKAKLGLALSYQQLGDLEKALATADTGVVPTLKTLSGQLLKAKAWQAIESGHLNTAQQHVDRAESIVGLDTEIRELNAWLADKAGDNARAASLFESLYQENPTEDYARGFVNNQALTDRSLLETKARRQGSLLWNEYKKFHAQELYYRKQFLSAYNLAPDLFPEMTNIDSPYADVGVYARHKSGRNGMDRLNLFRLPVLTGSYVFEGVHQFKLAVSRVVLDSGAPGFCSDPIGSLDPTLIGCQGGFAGPFLPTKNLGNSVEIDFLYRKDGWFSPYLRLGSTPITGVTEPAITFDVGFIQQTGFGNWGLHVYSQPVRQSILSYSGIRDPYLNRLTPRLPAANNDLEWGRVLRSGVATTGFYQFNEQWGASASTEIAMLTGDNVTDNLSVAASIGLGRNFDIPGFDYFTVGPSLIYEHYQKNLSYFTFGHGGYFSPNHYINTGLGVNFLTDEGKPFVIKGRAVVGAQIIDEAATPWFPEADPSRGRYGARNDFGEALDFELKGVWLVTQNIQLGAGAAMRSANNFEDYTGGFFIRYFFEERKASFSTDIPDGMFGNMLFY